MTQWQDLLVVNEGEELDSLGELVRLAPANLDNAVIENGRSVEWQDYFLAAPGEDYDADTPRGEVDWSGFEDALRTESERRKK